MDAVAVAGVARPPVAVGTVAGATRDAETDVARTAAKVKARPQPLGQREGAALVVRPPTVDVVAQPRLGPLPSSGLRPGIATRTPWQRLPTADRQLFAFYAPAVPHHG